MVPAIRESKPNSSEKGRIVIPNGSITKTIKTLCISEGGTKK